MRKNTIIVVLSIVLLAILLWPSKQQPPTNNESPQQETRGTQRPRSTVDRERPSQPYTPNANPQQFPFPATGYQYPNQTSMIPYGTQYTQPRLYGTPRNSNPYSQQPYSKQHYPQQNYAPNTQQHPQYYAPRYRFRDPSTTEPQNRSTAERREYDAQPRYTPNTIYKPPAYTPYQQNPQPWQSDNSSQYNRPQSPTRY